MYQCGTSVLARESSLGSSVVVDAVEEEMLSSFGGGGKHCLYVFSERECTSVDLPRACGGCAREREVLEGKKVAR
jgi:hypothetical protein